MRELAFGLITLCVHSPITFISSCLSVFVSHLSPCGRVIGEGVLAAKRGRFCPHLFLAVRLNHTGLAPAQNMLVIPGVETLGLFGVGG